MNEGCTGHWKQGITIVYTKYVVSPTLSVYNLWHLTIDSCQAMQPGPMCHENE